MMAYLPKNKWLLAAIIWFAAAIYALILRESPSNMAAPFPHFDKVAHCLLFFAQFILLARAFWVAGRRVPVWGLLGLALLMAVGTEWAQGAFTQTRQADVWDAVADMCGALLAMWFARHAKVWHNKPSVQS